MTVDEILNEIRSRAGDDTIDDAVLLTKVNNEYDQTNLTITNLNEDYFFTEDAAFTVTASPGPYPFTPTFAKFRALIAPSGAFVGQVSPSDPGKPYGWYFSGTVLDSNGKPVKQITFNASAPYETGDYKLRTVDFPAHLDGETYAVPLWPEVFHEILVLGALKRLFSIEDIYDKFPDLSADLKELKETLVSQVGSLNLGAARQVRTQPGDLD